MKNPNRPTETRANDRVAGWSRRMVRSWRAAVINGLIAAGGERHQVGYRRGRRKTTATWQVHCSFFFFSLLLQLEA